MSGVIQRKLLDPFSCHPHCAFWREVHANFIDICVLDWCKLFSDRNGKHHWRRVVKGRDSFEADLFTKLGITAAQFAGLIEQTDHYRDKFVAHLDGERIMRPPPLDVSKAAVAFLHERLVREKRKSEDWHGLPTTAEQFEAGFEQASHEAQAVYDEALQSIRR
jgi:hypothetical protein